MVVCDRGMTWRFLLASCLVSASCGEPDAEPVDSGVGVSSERDASLPPAEDCSSLPRVAGPSESCCPAHGPDACGANLFCAVFDGRTVATCYGQRSRLDGESCAEDRHCLSGECNESAGRCKASPSATCTLTVGCAASPTGDRLVCAPFGTGGLRCVPTRGREEDPCEGNSDCDSERCSDSVCQCAPACGARTCGNDGCGGSCGNCGDVGTCGADGQCECFGGAVSCDGGCFLDDEHCGSCGRSCPARTGCNYSHYSREHRCITDFYVSRRADERCDQTCEREGFQWCQTARGPRGPEVCSSPFATECLCWSPPT